MRRPVTRNRIASDKYNGIGWAPLSDGMSVVELQELDCGCEVMFALSWRTMTWRWWSEVVCATHAAVN